MRTTAAKRCDSHGWYYRDFGIHPDHMASFGYLDKDKYPEIWEVEIEPDENQEGIGEDWDSCEYFGYVDYPIHPNLEVNLKGYPGDLTRMETPYISNSYKETSCAITYSFRTDTKQRSP